VQLCPEIVWKKGGKGSTGRKDREKTKRSPEKKSDLPHREEPKKSHVLEGTKGEIDGMQVEKKPGCWTTQSRKNRQREPKSRGSGSIKVKKPGRGISELGRFKTQRGSEKYGGN